MATERKAEPRLTEAAAKTTAVLQTLQSRLKREASPPEERAESRDELGEQLQRYFATAAEDQTPAKIPGEVRRLVIDGVVDRILRSWGEPGGQLAASIKNEVIERLVEHVLAELLRKGAAPR